MKVIKSWRTDKEDYKDKSLSWTFKPCTFSQKAELPSEVKSSASLAARVMFREVYRTIRA